MLPASPDFYHLIANFAAQPEESRRRKEMLTLVCILSDQYGRSASLLWLYDADKECFHLNHYEPMDDGCQLARISVACPRDLATNVEQFHKVTLSSKRVADWLAARSLGQFRTAFPLTPYHGGAGFVEVITATPITPKSAAALKTLAEVVATRITRHRILRNLRVYEQLTEGTIRTEGDGMQLWPKVAARVACEGAYAKAALVFRQTSDLSLRVAAAEPSSLSAHACVATINSLIYKVFERRWHKRVLDHTNETERLRLFGTKEFDRGLTKTLEALLGEPLRSWIAASVTCDGEPVAVILVANKDDKSLPGVFNDSDEELIKKICGVLSQGLAQAQTNLGIRQISDHAFSKAVTTKAGKLALLKLVSQHVPGIVAGAVSLRYLEDGPPDHVWQMGELEPQFADVLKERVDRGVKGIPRDPSRNLAVAGPCFVYEERLPQVADDRIAILHLLSRRQRLARFEMDVLGYLSVDLGQLIRSEQTVRLRLEELVQIRHAMRSGLQGVQHIDNAWEVYEQIARRGMNPSDFRVGMLRRSLEYTRLFSERCRHLLEESRFLLDNLTRDQLRLGGHSISNVVKEALRCLAPDAEDRGVEFNFQSIPSKSEEDVSIDRLLIYITVFNLIDNAVKYSHRKQTIRVSLSMTPREWSLKVSDIGVYILPEDRDAIFQPMIRRPTGQAQSSRPGTGLGLAVVKQIIDAHGGRISVGSRPLNRDNPNAGAETTFVIYVPRNIQ